MVTEEKQLAQTETELDSQMALKLMNHAMFQSCFIETTETKNRSTEGGCPARRDHNYD